MKATGIVRRIDDLGRVVVPKEIRRTLRIREGDPLEIFTDKEGEIILKKYSPMGELGTFAQQYVDAVAATLGKTVAICDRDQIIAAYGSLKKEILGLPLHKGLEEVIHNRTSICGKIGEKEFFTKKFVYFALNQIISFPSRHLLRKRPKTSQYQCSIPPARTSRYL